MVLGSVSLDEPENILTGFAMVIDFIHIMADELNSPATGRVVVLRMEGLRRRLCGVKLRAVVAQFHGHHSSGIFETDLKRLLRIALESVVYDIAAGFLERQREAKQSSLWNTLVMTEFLQRFHGAHHLFRSGVQFQSHAPGAFCPDAVEAKRKERMAMSSDCGAVPANARTFCSNPAVMAGAESPAKAPASASSRSLP